MEVRSEGGKTCPSTYTCPPVRSRREVGGGGGGGDPTPSRGLMPYSSLLFSFLPKFARRWGREKEDRGTRNLFGKSLFGGVPLPSRVRPEKTRSAK